MSTSDSESDDNDNFEERQKLLAAIDPSFYSKIDHQLPSTANNDDQKKKKKSKRKQIEEERESDKAEIDFRVGFKLSKGSQKFIAKKLAETLNKKIKIKKKKTKLHDITSPCDTNGLRVEKEESGIFLLSNSTSPITESDLIKKEEENQKSKSKRKRMYKRRKLKDESSSEDEMSKARSVAVDANWVFSNPY